MKNLINQFQKIAAKLLSLAIVLLFMVSCGGTGSDEQFEQQQRDSIERAQAAMEAAREAALIKARIEDSLENLQMVDSLEEGNGRSPE